jgi:hypothetical protein
VDCEKFENLLIDELYGELDEVTSAAVRRHAAGCARCGALLSGLRATRKVAALPVEEPSSDLEDRILSAVREQQKVLPLRARFAVALSRAGAWAMRPQTAMAAVFLVVIGTSFVLVQSRQSAPGMMKAASNAEGAPVAAQAAPPGAMASAYALETKESSFAHGVEEKKLNDQPMATTAPATLAANEPANGLAKDKAGSDGDGFLDNRGRGGGGTGGSAEQQDREIANAAPVAGARRPMAITSEPSASDATKTEVRAQAQAAAPTFGAARQAYDAHRYDDARTQWDQLSGADPNAALWAGRAERAKNGGACTAAAIQRFESARTHAPSGSAIANDATLEAAHCYRANGNIDLARARLSSLLSQPGYAANAQNELDQLSPSAVAHKAAHMSPAPVARPVQPAQGSSY